MFIHEIPQGSKLTLQVGEAFAHITTFVVSDEHVIRTDLPAYHEIPVSIKTGMLTVYNCEDNRTYVAKDVTVNCYGKQVYMYYYEDMQPLDYRRAPRIPCTAKAQVIISGDTVEGQLVDISTCGIAFKIPKRSVHKFEIVNVAFTAEPSFWSFNLKASVVRKKELPDGSMLLGCEFVEYYSNLVALCNYLSGN